MAKNSFVAEVTFNLEVGKNISCICTSKFHIRPQVLFFGLQIG